jgi:hypothetical protein
MPWKDRTGSERIKRFPRHCDHFKALYSSPRLGCLARDAKPLKQLIFLRGTLSLVRHAMFSEARLPCKPSNVF